MREETASGGRRSISTMTPSNFALLSEYLWPKGERRDLWMIVDGARSLRVFETLLESSFLQSCLYGGFIPRALEASVPYLVQLERDDAETRRLLMRAWGNSWGVLLRCDTAMNALRKHLRSFLKVRDSKGERLLFRYYDPRVLRVYLPSCTGEELRTLFGPVECFWTEGETPDEVVRFTLEGTKLVRSAFSLTERQEQPAWGGSTEERPRMRIYPGMLSVRDDQVARFKEAAQRQFEEWMIQHLRRFFAKRCERMGEARVRELVEYGIRRAASYGITMRREVCKYIDVMVVLGRDFDRDARYGWAQQILSGNIAPSQKGTLLLSTTRTHLGTMVRH